MSRSIQTIQPWQNRKKASIPKSQLQLLSGPTRQSSFVAGLFPLIVIHSVFLPALLSWLIVLFPHCWVFISSSYRLIINVYASSALSGLSPAHQWLSVTLQWLLSFHCALVCPSIKWDCCLSLSSQGSCIKTQSFPDSLTNNAWWSAELCHYFHVYSN